MMLPGFIARSAVMLDGYQHSARGTVGCGWDHSARAIEVFAAE